MRSHAPVAIKGRYVWMTVVGLALIILVDHAGFFQGLNTALYDLAFRLRGPQAPPSRIVIVAIDENTLKTYGRWPLSRRYYAALLEQVRQADAVGFNLIFAEPSEDDAALTAVLDQGPGVVLPTYIDATLTRSYPARSFAAAKQGHIHLEQGVDGIVRDVFHTMVHQGSILPSFAAQLARLLGAKTVLPKDRPAAGRRPTPAGEIQQADLMTINYYGGHYTFPYVSFREVVEGAFPPTFFKHKVVLVGLTAEGSHNGILTPYTQDRNTMPAVEVQAHILANLLEQTDIHMSRPWQLWCGVILIGSFCFWGFVRLGSFYAMLVWLLSLGLLALGLYAFFAYVRFWINPASWVAAATFAFILASVCNLDMMWEWLRQAKKDWEESFHTINDAIIIFDQDSHLVRMNTTAQEAFDSSFLDHLRRRSLELLGRSGEPLPSAGAARDEVPALSFSQEHFDPASAKYLEVKSHLRPEAYGQPQGVVYVIRDVTEQRRSEAEQLSLQAQLLQAQKMETIGALAGGIAHDFNNILAAIQGYTELVRLTLPASSEARPHLEQVLLASRRAKELVHQILAFSRQTQHEKKPVDVSAIIEETLNLLRSSLPKSIEVREQIMASSSEVYADPTQLHQVLMNLCTNAGHAMEPSGGVLQVQLMDVDPDTLTAAGVSDVQPGPYLQLSISDTGHGMTRDVLDHLFDPFFTTKEPGKGTGLGLAVVHGIIKDHEGSIHVSSAPGQGATFDIYLPKASDQIRGQPEENRSLPKGDERILVVDDEQMLADMWQAMIEGLGYDVVATTSPIDALSVFRAQPQRFDLILTDMMMPKMNGDALAGELLAIRPDVPVILCTGFSEHMTVENAQSLGFKTLLLKPLSIYDLAPALRQCLERKVLAKS